MKIEIDYSKIEDVELAGIKTWDAHDFVDAFVEAATYDGRPMTDDELDVLNGDTSWVHERVLESLF